MTQRRLRTFIVAVYERDRVLVDLRVRAHTVAEAKEKARSAHWEGTLGVREVTR